MRAETQDMIESTATPRNRYIVRSLKRNALNEYEEFNSEGGDRPLLILWEDENALGLEAVDVSASRLRVLAATAFFIVTQPHYALAHEGYLT